MSIRMGLLAVLAHGPLHAYEMRRRFEQRTGGTWPLNMGQVSTTLGRLVKAGHVLELGPDPARDVTLYELSPAGRDELAAWWSTGTGRNEPERDELTVKVALALTEPEIDLEDFLQTHRSALVRSMQDLNRLRRSTDADLDPMWALTLERMLLDAEAQMRWLDVVTKRAPTILATLQAPASPTHLVPPRSVKGTTR